MNTNTRKTLKQLNYLRRHFCGWEDVASTVQIPARTIRKWRTGEQKPSESSRELVLESYEMIRRMMA